MLGDFFAPIAMKVSGGIIAALLIVLGVVTWRADAISNERDELQAWQTEVWGATKIAADRPKLGKDHVARQISYLGDGIGRLQDAIADMNAQAEQRAEAFAEARELAEKREKELARRERSTDSRIARLRALSKQKGQCAVTDELRELAEGL